MVNLSSRCKEKRTLCRNTSRAPGRVGTLVSPFTRLVNMRFPAEMTLCARGHKTSLSCFVFFFSETRGPRGRPHPAYEHWACTPESLRNTWRLFSLEGVIIIVSLELRKRFRLPRACSTPYRVLLVAHATPVV